MAAARGRSEYSPRTDDPMSTSLSLVSTSWDALCTRLALDRSVCDEWWQKLHSAYEGEGRYYHTLEHLAELLSHAHNEQHRTSISDMDAVELAIFFHDIVYDAKSGGGGKNELDSADIFHVFVADAKPRFAHTGAPEKIFKWIVATKDHRCTADDEFDMRFFMDIDMAILAAPSQRYAAYARQVRREYGHLSSILWCYGRSGFLYSFASSETPIFATEAFRRSGEARARQNARDEAAGLRQQLYLTLLAYAVALLVVLLAVLGRAGSPSRGMARLCSGAGALVLGGWGLTRFEAYPYEKPRAREESVALFAGSFNPLHRGHLAIIEHLAAKHRVLHVVIGHNRTKKYAVPPEARKRLCEEACRAAGLTNVIVELTDDYVWRLGHAVGAAVLYRGIRTWAQDGLAERQLELLNLLGPPVLALKSPLRTAYVQADPAYAHVSSTLVRSRLKEGERVDDLVPESIAAAVAKAYRS